MPRRGECKASAKGAAPELKRRRPGQGKDDRLFMSASNYVIEDVDLARLSAISSALAEEALPGDLILLDGPLAAGKTQFVKSFCDALATSDVVTSPTFSLAHFYAGGRLPVLHVDAYRIEDDAEFLDLALGDYLDDHVTMIEWGAKFAHLAPPALRIELAATGPSTRRITFADPEAAWGDRLNAAIARSEAERC